MMKCYKYILYSLGLITSVDLSFSCADILHDDEIKAPISKKAKHTFSVEKSSVKKKKTANQINNLNDDEMKASILKKAKHNFSVEQLSCKEKEWLYKKDLVNQIDNLKSDYENKPQNFCDFEDLTNRMAELKRFYIYTHQTVLVEEVNSQMAEWFIKAAIRGSVNHIALLNSYVDDKYIDSKDVKDIENLEENNQKSETSNHDKTLKHLQEVLIKCFKKCDEATMTSKKNKFQIRDDEISLIYARLFEKASGNNDKKKLKTTHRNPEG